MSVLDALDATRICARWSAPLADPDAWTVPMPSIATRRPPAQAQPGGYSWWSLARNPHAVLVTGMVGAVLAKDALLRVVAPVASRSIT